MPHRNIASQLLGELLGVLSHPHRLRLVEELGAGERDVQALQECLLIRHSAVSQHLSLLRAHRLVVERREGRHVYYRLRRPELAAWLLGGLEFLSDDEEAVRVQVAIAESLRIWKSEEPESHGS